jgi:hypothetical protein
VKHLLDKCPDVESFLQSRKVDPNVLKTLGIEIADIRTLKDLTDLMVILKSLSGNKEAKTYIDEQYNNEQSLNLLNAQSS